jgi:HTH-type transcriptional regulator/antitoxin HigA
MTRHGNFQPFEAIAPGETLREAMEAEGLSQADLVRRMNRPAKTINEIINGKAAITPDTALQLEHVLGIPATFWNNLERNYQLTIARLKEEDLLREQIPLLAAYPYTEMARHKWVPPTRTKVERVRVLLRFFGITSLEYVREVEVAAFRKSTHHEALPEALAAWLRAGVIKAQKTQTQPFDANKLRSALAYFRELTAERAFSFNDALEKCAACGVVVVAVPHLQKTHVNGATRWLTSERALIQLSIRYRYEDIFWFTFFHEVGHILLHGKKEVFIDVKNGQKTTEELEADTFAADALIPPDEYQGFVSRGRFGAADIRSFALGLKVGAGIVVGRLQYDNRLPHSAFNGLRRMLEWKTPADADDRKQ